MTSTSNQFALAVEQDRAASFWLKKAIETQTSRDVLDALRDAESLLTFCTLRAKECGLPDSVNNERT